MTLVIDPFVLWGAGGRKAWLFGANERLSASIDPRSPGASLGPVHDLDLQGIQSVADSVSFRPVFR